MSNVFFNCFANNCFSESQRSKEGNFLFKTLVRNNCKFHNRWGRNDFTKAQFPALGMHISKSTEKEFPDSPVLRTTNFHCIAQVQSLVRKLGSHKPCGAAKKEKRAQKSARNNLKAISSVQSLSCVQLFATPWIAARQACPSPTLGAYSNSSQSSRWRHPAISSSVIPFSSCPQSLPASGSFPTSQLFAWGGQSIGV